jgi:hypothetical protein
MTVATVVLVRNGRERRGGKRYGGAAVVWSVTSSVHAYMGGGVRALSQYRKKPSMVKLFFPIFYFLREFQYPPIFPGGVFFRRFQ